MRHYINVHIGEVKIAKNGEVLKSILGSCVGIGFIWEEKKICGLAHCLLPQMPIKSFQIGARFVDQAVPSLVALMKIRHEDKKKIKVIVAGGSNMTNQDKHTSNLLVGEQNIDTTKAVLEKDGFKILVLEKGTIEGKKIIIDAQNFTYTIETIPNIGAIKG